ncbi:FeoA domain-containing protein [Leptolyngbya sp. PCC 7375]|nr:FeoA domain-containing protein [Leptolyngbya sp. PCC 7375]
MFTSFTVSGASLKALKVGEHGVISRIRGINPAVVDQLRKAGLSPGTSLSLEQRSPRFVVRTRQGTVPLTQAMIQSVYVRTKVS